MKHFFEMIGGHKRKRKAKPEPEEKWDWARACGEIIDLLGRLYSPCENCGGQIKVKALPIADDPKTLRLEAVCQGCGAKR